MYIKHCALEVLHGQSVWVGSVRRLFCVSFNSAASLLLLVVWKSYVRKQAVSTTRDCRYESFFTVWCLIFIY